MYITHAIEIYWQPWLFHAIPTNILSGRLFIAQHGFVLLGDKIDS